MIDFTTSTSPDGSRIVRLGGQLDLIACEYFFDCIQDEIENGHLRIVIDCKDLGVISSAGLGMLIRARARVKKHGGIIILARLQNSVADVLALVHLDRIFKIYPTVEDALQAVQGMDLQSSDL